MSTLGLRKVGNFENVLARITKDEQYIDGTIAPGIQDYAKQVINSPDFQRVRDTLENDLVEQERRHIDAQQAQHNITNLAVDARINRSDLDYIVNTYKLDFKGS